MALWVGTDTDETVLTEGTYRFWFSYPTKAVVPDIAPGKTVDFNGKRFTLINWETVEADKKLGITVKVETIATGLNAGSEYINSTNAIGTFRFGAVSAVAEQMIATKLQSGVPLAVIQRNEPKLFSSTLNSTAKPTYATNANTTSGIPIVAVLAVVAGLIGLTLVFLTFDRVEKLVDSPAGSLFVVAIGLGIIFFLYKAFKTT